MKVNFLCLTLITMVCSSACGETVQVAVASNFLTPMKKITQQFERQTGHKVLISSGSSGKIFAQISHGAPFDVFLSADREKPRALEEQGKAVSGSRMTYARGTLALWSITPEPEKRLKMGEYHKVAIANPRYAPYGEAAIATLKKLELYGQARDKLVVGENIAQAYQFVSSGNADLGFVALSQVTEHHQLARGYVWIIPANLHNPICQDAILLNRGANNPAAQSLMNYLSSGTVQTLLQSYGYNRENSD